jgi:asparagine synthase (glutamine-hydrolysing)
MCGILGLISKNDLDESELARVAIAADLLTHRGPDFQDLIQNKNVALAHTRLSIIDLEARSNQPLTDATGRYTIVFNGEIYNYKELKVECENAGIVFRTESDTEVLLYQFILNGKQSLAKLNGCFAFAVYDRASNSVFMARDRMGIKPLVYFFDNDHFAFASEMKSLLAFDFKRELDKVSAFTFFKLNYIPAPHTILQRHFKLEPGHCAEVSISENKLVFSSEVWYEIPYDPAEEKAMSAHDYKQSQAVLKRFVRESVRRRLVADVPVGTFLSGGIDSSIITAIAKQEKSDIAAYSIGFPNHKYYDESNYARKVAKHIGVEHHVFDLTDEELLSSAEEFLEHIDEPFGDSSILNVNILSRKVGQHLRVALSGDGGDELFAGYHKHAAEFRLRNPKFAEHTVGRLAPIFTHLPSSRSGKISNTIRQIQKFGDGYSMSKRDRYWRWAGVLNEEQANYLMREEILERQQRLSDIGFDYKKRKDYLLKALSKTGTLNEVLLTDAKMVLPNDMLFKVDFGSMKHHLEVRTPLLDQTIVKFAFRLPIMFKVNHHMKKKILQDSYRDILPNEVFDRAKKGFEVPLLEWMTGGFRSRFESYVNDEQFILEQGLFNPAALKEYSSKLFSKNPGDSATWAWSFMVFQTWYKKYM